MRVTRCGVRRHGTSDVGSGGGPDAPRGDRVRTARGVGAGVRARSGAPSGQTGVRIGGYLVGVDLGLRTGRGLDRNLRHKSASRPGENECATRIERRNGGI